MKWASFPTGAFELSFCSLCLFKRIFFFLGSYLATLALLKTTLKLCVERRSMRSKAGRPFAPPP